MLDTIINYSKEHIFNILLILLISLVLRKILQTVSNTIVHRSLRIENFTSQHEMIQREDTLNGIFKYVISVFISVIAFLLILSELEIDIAPLIASAGIAGVALGFGAQSVVQDFLAGLFILAENQYRIGDVVTLQCSSAPVTGSVEDITLRKTTLRDLDGQVHYVANGQIEFATNMTMGHANVNLDIGVAYDTDIEKLEKIINQVGKDLAEDPEWKNKVLESPQFVRIDNFGDSSIVVKIVGRTQPLMQWSTTGELRKRLKIAFDKNGIEIPFPQRVIHEAPKPKPKK